ncbi:MAG: spore coat protein CotJB [Bacilli bacterium]|nr:spore coat protein CotJB [Bacilli bacterium]
MYNYNEFVNNYRLNNDMNSNMFDFNNFYNEKEIYNMNSTFDNMNMNMNMNTNVNLFNPEEGYEKGNLFKNLYSQYKNYNQKKLQAKDEKTRLWLDMSKNLFAQHELNLYLDINPNDESMIALFNDYRNKANQLKEQYEKSFGPICITSDVLNNSPFLWEEMAWPWEGDKN